MKDLVWDEPVEFVGDLVCSCPTTDYYQVGFKLSSRDYVLYRRVHLDQNGCPCSIETDMYFSEGVRDEILRRLQRMYSLGLLRWNSYDA